MSFATQLANDLDRVFLNTGEFAEQLTYYPVDGQPRTVTAVVHRGGRDQENETHHRQQVDAVDLLVKSDAAAGIDNPQLGDAIRLAEDAQTVRWAFDQQMHADHGARVLRYRKKQLQRSGFPKPDRL